MTIQDIIDNAKLQAIVDQMQDFSEDDRLTIWNGYCSDMCNPDDQVFSNDDEFFALCTGGDHDAKWLLERAFYGDYNPNHAYVSFNGYGNFVSSAYPDELMSWCDDDIAEYLLDDEHWFIDWEQVEECVANRLESYLACYTNGKYEFLDMAELYDYVVNNCEDMEVEEAVAEYLEYIQE